MIRRPSKEERAELLHGLRSQPPTISPRYFYDEAGSKLFAQITRTKEYYPTRTELALLREQGSEIARHIARGSVVIELGSGSGDKVVALLSHLDAPRAYRPIDISPSALAVTEREVRRAFGSLEVLPYGGDFADAEALDGLPPEAPLLVYYSGSTIGNFDPSDAIRFLSRLRARLRPGDVLLLAVDLVKDEAILNAAYNDAQNVTAAFNRNILHHINARFGASFDPEAFAHNAFYNARKRRIEMHLVPAREQSVRIGEEALTFSPTHPIHTESSYKFDFDDIHALAKNSGFRLDGIVSDPKRWFAEAILRAP
ncbi:MAG: L-histidine N(alpha)-methyltransferase [Polyangiaceae bacterium]|nr:L-histidine N(alpha)-methyltransferase [Polyangiaceae bacterium]